MNLKKIEEGIKKSYLSDNLSGKDEDHIVEEFYFNEVERWVKFAICQAIKQVVESVPVEEKEHNLDFDIRDTPADGYNQHVQEIKQWKKKILKELGGK